MILDALIIVTVAYFVYDAHKRGVIKSVLSLASLVVSYFAAMAFSPVVAGFIERTHIVELFTKNMSAALSEGDSVLPGLKDAGSQFVEEFTSLTGTGSLLDASLDVINLLYSQRVTSVLGFIIVFFVAVTACRIAINIINVAAMLPVLGSINRFFGLIFGFLQGIVMCFAVCIVVSFVAMFFGDELGIHTAIPETKIYLWFHENNLLTRFIPWKI